MDDSSLQAELARLILRPFRDVQSGGEQPYDDQAWWIEDVLDRIELAITPHLVVDEIDQDRDSPDSSSG